jgi:hypothetical protein
MSVEDDISSLEQALKKDTDISIGIRELFRDSIGLNDTNLDHHPVDIRTRLVMNEIRAMSVTNFISGVSIKNLKPSKNIKEKDIKDVAYDEESLALGLNCLMHNIKRHKISFEGKSRNEIIEMIKGSLEQKKPQGLASLFQPH